MKYLRNLLIIMVIIALMLPLAACGGSKSAEPAKASGETVKEELKEVKRNTIDNALVAAIDGSEAALLEVKKPESALKVDVGNPTKEMAEITWDSLKKVMDNSLAEKKAILVPFVYIPPEKADEWLATQFPK